jgi:hypothetical protein
MDPQAVEDAITACRDGSTFDVVHPLNVSTAEPGDWLWDPASVRDLARVIAALADGREAPSAPVPWEPGSVPPEDGG